jgi:hypothetical protein
MSFQESRQFPKVTSKTAEPLHRFICLLWRNRHIMLAIAYVNACCIRMYRIEPRIICPDLLLARPCLLPIGFHF